LDFAQTEAKAIEVFPVSTDVRVIDKPELTIMDFLPDANALQMTSNAMREWIGKKVYEFQGWG
jgi:hypothetical protein